MTFFLALPACGIMAINVFLHMKKEWECPPPRPEFIPYDHLRIRNKVQLLFPLLLRYS